MRSSLLVEPTNTKSGVLDLRGVPIGLEPRPRFPPVQCRPSRLWRACRSGPLGGGIVYASLLRSMSTSFDGGTIVHYVVASAVIGGTSMFGGRGHPLHPVLGGIVIAGIVNGMALLGLPAAAIQLMATAVVLIVSILVDVLVRRRAETSAEACSPDRRRHTAD